MDVENVMIIRNPGFEAGYNPIVNFNDLPWDDPKNPKINFGILQLAPNQSYRIDDALEKAVLLMHGKVLLNWNNKNDNKETEAEISRDSIWDKNPWCLHVDKNTSIEIKADQLGAELAIVTTKNEQELPAKLYTPEECESEERGKGTMRETSTRIVRTIFDDSNEPLANLVLGEVINFPGKWSSYPPHKHEMPEIYHYRFLPEQGFGFSMLGDDAVQIHDGDTVGIFNEWHSQTSAPGYAMYYIWPIRHLKDKRYGKSSDTPVFDPQHLWVTNEENESKIFPEKEE
ncbi:MAG: 5-deoxyglucuronate isomerase [Candidatus Lokiarchaeota archaeon]|nr:5-deoxyglucuronate isomerase [Candidatus Lokiarchaeota archaeon]